MKTIVQTIIVLHPGHHYKMVLLRERVMLYKKWLKWCWILT